MKLDRVTITGADDSIKPQDLVRLSWEYPFVEWGILLSRSSEGRPRFPSLPWLRTLVEEDPGPPVSGHLCGSWVRDACQGLNRFWSDRAAIAGYFKRIQLNFHAIVHTIDREPFVYILKRYEPEQGFIFQLDDVNNAILSVAAAAGVRAYPLFDLSGGAGVLPESWPKPNADYCGYAGGLSPDNLQEQLERIAAAAGDARVWIDVETHVRSRGDARFDLAKVERFLKVAAPWVTKERWVAPERRRA